MPAFFWPPCCKDLSEEVPGYVERLESSRKYEDPFLLVCHCHGRGRENIGVLVIPWARRETIRSPTEDTQASCMRPGSTCSCLLTFIHVTFDAQMCMLLLALCGFPVRYFFKICLPLLVDSCRHFSRWERWCSMRSNVVSRVVLSRLRRLFALSVPITALDLTSCALVLPAIAFPTALWVRWERSKCKLSLHVFIWFIGSSVQTRTRHEVTGATPWIQAVELVNHGHKRAREFSGLQKVQSTA